ncbi:MAG: dNTP triphosphohydrolase, partial [Planctomycetes bacterium]|nr:dNTP triphosphohydrolase [Planctomycetota bacterium]
MIERKDLEERELATLSPYACRAAESRGRRHPEPEHPYRTAFQRDRDRVIHCTAFRRLQYKTQVFVNHEGDYYRTRLTHTMEAAQIARTIARALGANEDLTEAITLAHDLGHTPFGHAGQDALDALLRAVRPDEPPRRFEHNRQSLRIVDYLERRYGAYPGLNLSYEVREAIAKHSRSSAREAAFPESADAAEPHGAGIDLGGFPTLEAQIADVSDALAYDHHDLDDGL